MLTKAQIQRAALKNWVGMQVQEQDYVQSLSSSEGESIHVGVDSGQKRVPDILAIAAERGFSVSEVGIDRPNLGDVFFAVTGREIRD